MLKVSVKAEVKAVEKWLTDIQKKQLPFATAKALTRTGQKIKEAEIAEMKSVLENPTPFTLKALQLRPATKQNLTAIVWFKDFAGKGNPAGQYLLPQIQGGQRKLKRSERWLGNRYLVPGKSVKLDKYGNMPKGQLTKALANTRALPDAAQHTRKGGRGYANSKYFYATIRGVSAVWERYGPGGKNIRPYLVAVRNPNYQKRFDFFGVANRTFNANFKREFYDAFTNALRTAR